MEKKKPTMQLQRLKKLAGEIAQTEFLIALIGTST